MIKRHLREATTPLPKSFPDTEIALMTKSEFLDFRNPRGKSHDSDAYEVTFADMNEGDRGLQYVGGVNMGNYDALSIDVYKNQHGYLVYRKSDSYRFLSKKLVAVVRKGVMFYSDEYRTNQILDYYLENNHNPEPLYMGVKRKKAVKYIGDYKALVSNNARYYLERYPDILQRVRLKGEYFTIRTSFKEGDVAKRGASRVPMAVIVLDENANRVADVSWEWGAILVRVAKELRGRGLGGILLKVWHKYWPNSESGGYTPQGRPTDLKFWETEVRDFLSKGWYSELVRSGRITKERVREILSGTSWKNVGSRIPDSPRVEKKKKPEILLHSDRTNFILYDRAFFDNPSEEFIYAHGFFRDNDNHWIIYKIDYDRPFRQLAHEIMFQIAKDNGERVWDRRDKGGDALEVRGVRGLSKEGDFLFIAKDLIPLRDLNSKESQYRKSKDKYGELFIQLQEMAESKWRD